MIDFIMWFKSGEVAIFISYGRPGKSATAEQRRLPQFPVGRRRGRTDLDSVIGRSLDPVKSLKDQTGIRFWQANSVHR